jgi:hypothetical protein
MLTRGALRSLRARAYTREDFELMIADTPFGAGDIRQDGVGFEITLKKPLPSENRLPLSMAERMAERP